MTFDFEHLPPADFPIIFAQKGSVSDIHSATGGSEILRQLLIKTLLNGMPKSIYVESTIPSYLAARPCRDIIQTARQQLTHSWWQYFRSDFDLFISEMVIDEIKQGDPIAAEKRLDLVKGLPLLDITDSVRLLAKEIMRSGLLPQRATRDAIHIAVAAVHRIDILLTWNCRHIANATIMREIRTIVEESGHELSTLCTPEELVGD